MKKRFLKAERGHNKKKKEISQQRMQCLGKVALLPGTEGVYQNFLVLTRKFHDDWLKVTFLGD